MQSKSTALCGWCKAVGKQHSVLGRHPWPPVTSPLQAILRKPIGDTNQLTHFAKWKSKICTFSVFQNTHSQTCFFFHCRRLWNCNTQNIKPQTHFVFISTYITSLWKEENTHETKAQPLWYNQQCIALGNGCGPFILFIHRVALHPATSTRLLMTGFLPVIKGSV
jgi:hypothetical protein